MAARCLALVPTSTTGQNNRADFLSMRVKSALFDIPDFRHRQKSGGENCEGLGQRMLQKGLRQGHFF
jgi:hypothetical protein